jgi:hypothetical protein
MVRRLTKLGSIALVAGGLLAGGSIAPAGAATPSAAPADTFSFVVASAHWTLNGHVAGRPGNAHSGDLVFDTSEAEIVGSDLDWNCPAGVTPPVEYAGSGDTSTRCTIVRDRYFTTPGSESSQPTFSGPLHAVIDGPFDFSTIDATTGESTSDALRPVDLTFNRVGPVRTTTSTTSDGTSRTRTVILTAPMRIAGNLDTLSFGNPRMRQTFDIYQRETDYTTQTS